MSDSDLILRGGRLDSRKFPGRRLPPDDQLPEQRNSSPTNKDLNNDTAATPSSSSTSANEENTGTAWYTPLTLPFYDYHVLGFNMSFVWRCPTSSVLLPFFRQNFTLNHLDVGVATGYFPSAALLQLQQQQQQQQQQQKENHQGSSSPIPTTTTAAAPAALTLMDLNPHSLEAARSRILRDNSNPGSVEIETVQHDALSLPAPGVLRRRRFASVSMFNLLHCIPAPCEEKTRAFELAAQCLLDGGVLAGCTVLPVEEAVGAGAGGWWRVPLAGLHLRVYNSEGGRRVFGNLGDTREVLERGLRRWFDEVEVKVVGCMLLFRGKGPKRAGTEEDG
ncbi:hypothetical protein QBC42DRAFT_255163 [Cladorrhinum samala]|uniref:Methyltransferase domain-containing protein n=1 Tax=Cladorrhinum samala TaxID=585594 RepID=A0AAV9HGN5_9PEZI|nr:hypothetical protein QBC42DRAFT_255163 [Cladorrhinum samala]